MAYYATGPSFYRWIKKEKQPLELNEQQAKLLVSTLAADQIQLRCKEDQICMVFVDGNGQLRRNTNLEEVILRACEANEKFHTSKQKTLSDSLKRAESFQELSLAFKEYRRLLETSIQFRQLFEQTGRYENMQKQLKQTIQKPPAIPKTIPKRQGR